GGGPGAVSAAADLALGPAAPHVRAAAREGAAVRADTAGDADRRARVQLRVLHTGAAAGCAAREVATGRARLRRVGAGGRAAAGPGAYGCRDRNPRADRRGVAGRPPGPALRGARAAGAARRPDGRRA